LGISPSKKQMGGSKMLAGITASEAAHPFSWGVAPKTGSKGRNGASKSLISGILSFNPFVFSGLEQVINHVNH